MEEIMNFRTTFGIIMMVVGTNGSILSYGSPNEKLMGASSLIVLFIGSISFLIGTKINK